MLASNQALLGSAGGIAMLLNVCKQHMNNAHLVQIVCGAIWNACYNNGMHIYPPNAQIIHASDIN